jgi:hypothetical protein
MSLSKISSTASVIPEWLHIVQEKVESLSYGIVQIVIHDKKVTQIERTEKTRLDALTTESIRRRENY